MTKTDAAAASLSELNPDVQIEAYNINITSVQGFREFRSSLTCPETGKSRIDLLLSCVDNYEARVHINRVCLDLQQDWMESGVSEDAMSGMMPIDALHMPLFAVHDCTVSWFCRMILTICVAGHIQMISPGQTACFECAPPLAIASGLDESTLQRQDVCSASLPTTMGIISGLLVQNALKALLGFGDVTQCLGYMSLSDYFPRQRLRPNPDCTQSACVQLQQFIRYTIQQCFHYAGFTCMTEMVRQCNFLCRKHALRETSDKPSLPSTDDNAGIAHEENSWNICVIARSNQNEKSDVSLPVADEYVATSDRSVRDLMTELEESLNR